MTEIDDQRLGNARSLLRLTYGAVAFLAGLDKFFNLLTNWEKYVSPTAAALSPIGAPALMHVVGVIEMAVGLLILTHWTRVGAYLASAWLLLIACNLVLTGAFFDIAVRDAALAAGAWTLAKLSEAHDSVAFRSAAHRNAVGALQEKHS
jgi:uncharacterized membrane protein YphA (DoxX/SURF4 family)